MNEASKVFYCLCFCICSPQTKYESNKIVNERLKRIGFLRNSIEESELQNILRPVRFFKNKSKYLLELKSKWAYIKATLIFTVFRDSFQRREVLIKNIKGLGMKTASMFLREIGYDDLAIIDVHILKFLNAKIPRDKKEYLKLERKFCAMARERNLSPGDFDSKVWLQYRTLKEEKKK